MHINNYIENFETNIKLLEQYRLSNNVLLSEKQLRRNKFKALAYGWKRKKKK